MPGPSPIEAVLFDAYGTLIALDDPVARLRAALADRGEVRSPQQVSTAFAQEVRFYREHQDAGDTVANLAALRRRCARVFRDAVGSDLPVDDVHDVLMGSLRYRVFPDVVPTLDVLAARGIRLAVVSNWDASLPQILTDLDLADRFAAIVVSAVVGARKPDPRIFVEAVSALGCPPDSALHVGNQKEEDLTGARAAGLSAVLIDRDGSNHESGDTIRSLEDLPTLVVRRIAGGRRAIE